MSCTQSTDKKYVTRPSPPVPANQCVEGTVKIGNDGHKWIIKTSSNGVNRWVKYTTQSKPLKKKSSTPSKPLKKKSSTSSKPLKKKMSVQSKPLKKKMSVQSKPLKKKMSTSSNMTIPKIKQILDKKGIKYKKSAKKAELMALLK